jgi:hypothetical protein
MAKSDCYQDSRILLKLSSNIFWNCKYALLPLSLPEAVYLRSRSLYHLVTSLIMQFVIMSLLCQPKSA